MRARAWGFLSELKHGSYWNDKNLKKLTGGDTIEARKMRQDIYEFDPTVKLMIIGNDKPKFNNIDDAIRRRLILVEFTRKANRPDTGLKKYLLDNERGQILAWKLRGAADYLRDGLIALPASIQAATDSYLEDEDHFGRFIEDCCTSDPNGRTTNPEFKGAYTFWCISNGVQNVERSGNDVIRELKNRGYQSYKSMSARGFRGIKITTADPVTPFS